MTDDRHPDMDSELPRHPMKPERCQLGMDTRRVIARFDTERQALALMSHPNIARVFDVGTTEKGKQESLPSTCASREVG